MLVPMAQIRFVFVGMLLCAFGPGCSSSPQQAETVWPPADFRLEVEWTSGGAPENEHAKRFVVRADGLCVFGKSASPLVDPVSKAALPVFDTMCAYRVRSECVRLFARKLEQRGITKLELQQGAMDAADAPAVRIVHRAFGKEHAVTAVGQVHGALVRVLHVVNAHLPPSESFFLPGMTGDPEPENLADVPAPVAGAPGALAWHEEQLRADGDQPGLLLDAFALACRAKDRARSEALLARWDAATRVVASKDAPFVDAPRLLPEMLRRMLP